MDELISIWPIVSAIVAVAAIAIAFRSEILIRVKVLEEKVHTLFDLFNNRKR